ncbi:hypothetical protein [Winogradskyella sediminis]|uniref:hypothetical protein n=1 Tax=Winogradskyella sediminis TaxID=1382466 RepID=UPI003AA94BC1
MDLLKRIKDRAPEYDSRYFDMILNFTIEQGSGMGRTSEEERWKQGKYFSTRYEMYMYASLLGLKKDYNLPIAAGTDKKKFIEIKSWQPYDIADYVIMGVLAKSDIDFNELENMQEEEVEKKITGLKSLLEGYANGGFDIIRSKMDEEESFFLNDNCFLDLLDE